VRTVSVENQGRFIETWDGLDDNFLPVPPGQYAIKGIYMPANKWQVDGEYHSITPQFVGGASAWLPTPQQWNKPEPFGGDPVGQPLSSVAVGPNGIGVFYYVYLENGLNCPLIDLNKPVNYEQFIRAYNSGGAAGGSCVATDGQSVWAYSTDGGPKFVYRADQKPFGHDTGANRNNVYRPEGWVKAMTAWRDPNSGKSFVYIGQCGKVIRDGRAYVESHGDSEQINKVTVHDGQTGEVLAEVLADGPEGLTIYAGKLYMLSHDLGGQFEVQAVPLEGGLPHGDFRNVYRLLTFNHSGFAIDSHGRVYIGDLLHNVVTQFDLNFKFLRKFGRLREQVSGQYDPLTLMSPGRFTTWTDRDGNDRLIIVEQAGPNRVTEWSADGKLIREFPSLQTKANDGYAVDPEHPDHLYIGGHDDWLTRFKFDYEKHTWTIDAVWPHVGDDPLSPNFDHPQFIRVNGREYLACGRSNNVYRHAGDRWILSAAIIREKKADKWEYFSWHDVNGDGHVREADYRKNPLAVPGAVIRYHGNQWMDDLSLVAINQGGQDVWRLAPDSFDSQGNPIFTHWQKLLTDPILEARARHSAPVKKAGDRGNAATRPVETPTEASALPFDSIHGGNELADKFSSDWAMVDGSMKDGFYVVARGGPNFSANEGSQTKISRYVPSAHGGYALKWRTGREAMQRLAEPGEIYGAIHIRRPINGLLSVVDQSRCGILLYTQDGLYVDTIFPDGRRFSPAVAGVYPQPGEFFAGMIYPNAQNGKIYFGMGKFTPMLFEAQGWTLKDNPVKPLETVQKTVEISASQIASPPEIALSVRGGAGAAHVARFAPALGGVALDGSLAGWESCDPVSFSAGADQSVEVRCFYDPEHLYLRWHARLGAKFQPKPLQPADRIFTHDRLADTLSFYFQGDPTAKPDGPPEGRARDVRIVFGLFDDNGKTTPVALGMYPKFMFQGRPSPLTYATPVGKAAFKHVAVLSNIQLGSKIDDDGQGFVLAAAIPVDRVLGLNNLTDTFRTMTNFSATFAGHNKFWWANRDGSASRETYDEPTEARLYPGSWAPAEFQGLGNGVVIRNWLVCGPFGGPGAEHFQPDPRDKMKDAVRAFCEAAKYPPDDGKVDLAAIYNGEQLQGYWPLPGAIRWKPEKIADLDTRIILGPSAQTWYGATWVFAPADTELEFQFQYHPQTFLRFSLNGQVVQSGEVRAERDEKVPVAKKKLTLRRGWNQIMFRGYCVGYPPFRAGLVLVGSPEKLWALKLSVTPPKE
jgi:hypothetical protein